MQKTVDRLYRITYLASKRVFDSEGDLLQKIIDRPPDEFKYRRNRQDYTVQVQTTRRYIAFASRLQLIEKNAQSSRVQSFCYPRLPIPDNFAVSLRDHALDLLSSENLTAEKLRETLRSKAAGQAATPPSWRDVKAAIGVTMPDDHFYWLMRLEEVMRSLRYSFMTRTFLVPTEG